MSSAVSRIDCVLTPAPTEIHDQEEGWFPRVGAWADLSLAFVKATSPWIGRIEVPIHRVAFGSILLAQAPSREAGYEQLQPLVQSLKIDSEMRDLIYRVNWRRISASAKDLTINRITMFSVVQFKLGRVTISEGGVSAGNMVPTSDLSRLEMDHSTDQDRSEPFDQASLVPIYEELVALADENAKRGEVR